jgi:hypothetical protein
MATQTRVPGAASSEVEFQLERFELAGAGRLEIAGRWFGLRGRRFMRPVLNLRTADGRRRLVALLEHKPWAADDGKTWLAAFAWAEGVGHVEGAELEVGPWLAVELPAPGGELAGVPRVSALRPHPPARPALPREGDGFEPVAPRPAPRRDAVDAAQRERDEAIAARDEAERERTLALGERDDALSRRDAALRDVERANEERAAAVAERDRVQAELERVTHERDVAHAERNRTRHDQEAVERARDQSAAERDAARSELSRALPARDQALRERDAETARADQAESQRDTAYAERKSAVAQRDRARRERDRAMRAVGLDPPDDSPGALAPRARGESATMLRPGASRASAAPAAAAGPDTPAAAANDASSPAAAASDDPSSPAAATADDPSSPAAAAAADPSSPAAATAGDSSVRAADDPSSAPAAVSAGDGFDGDRAGRPLPSRPIKRIGAAAVGPTPEPKPLLTPVDGSARRRLSRTRPAPSAGARWAVRIIVVGLLIAIAIVAAMLVLAAI